MQVQKYSYIKGGKVFSVLLVLLAIFFAVVLAMFLARKSVDFELSFLIISLAVLYIWQVLRFSKAAFTKIVFTTESITSKVGTCSLELELRDVKGIWFLKSTRNEVEVEAYSLNCKPSEGSLVVIGDIKLFDKVHYLGTQSSYLLVDSFGNGYTTIYYRKELDTVLAYLYSKLEEKKMRVHKVERKTA